MTHVIELTLKFTSSQELLILAKTAQEEAQSYVEFPTESEDLIAELKSGKAIRSALEQAQHLVTDTLFPKEISQLMVKVLEEHSKDSGSNFTDSSPNVLVVLSTPDELQSWPWELILHPLSKRPLLLGDVELVRSIGKLPDNEKLNVVPSGQVLTKSSEVFKFSAMKAATSHISRKFKVTVRPLHHRKDLHQDPRGAIRLFNHVYAIDKNGLITLDTNSSEGALALNESTIARESILLNITPPIPFMEVIKTRRAGAMVVISRQFEQSVKTRAESDRALYHALGSGFSFVHALHWSRHALYQSEPEGYQWATLTLTTGEEDSFPTILGPFPPRFGVGSTQKPTLSQQQSNTDQNHEIVEGQVILSRKRRPLAAPVSTFVQETVNLIQKTQQNGTELDKANLALRTPMMRQLSAIVQKRKIKANPSLPRSIQLSQQLIEAGQIDDEILRLPNQWYGRAQRLADALGIRVDAVAQSTRALVSSPAVWIYGADAYTRLTFARGLCEEVFQAFPYEADLHLIDGAASNSSQYITKSLLKIADTSWNSEAQEEYTRQMMIAFHTESKTWRRYRRAFLLIDQAHNLPSDIRESTMVSLRSHQVNILSEFGEFSNVALPKETRVIYLSKDPPVEHQSEVVLSLSINPERIYHLWHRDLRSILSSQGLPLETIESRLTAPITQSFTSMLCLALQLDILSPTLAFDALHYGVATGSDIATFTESTELYVYPHLGLDELKRDCLYSYIQCDVEGFEASWIALYPDLTPPDLPNFKLDIPIYSK